MTIYCDESGYSGVNLLEKNQPYFVFSGVCLTEDLQQEIAELIHSKYKVQGEIKGKNLVQNDLGQKALLKVFQQFNSHAKIIYHDKKYALAAKIFENAIEPNLVSNSLAYTTGFHKFISIGLYSYFLTSTDNAEHIFQSFMDSIRGENKNSIFDIEHTDKEFLIWWLFEIVKFDPQVFHDEITQARKVSPWILEITSTSLLGILNDYGRSEKEFKVICDNSNLYKDNGVIKSLNHIGRYGKRAKFLDEYIGYKLKEDILILNSKNELGLQIADIFATSVGYSLRNRETDFSKEILDIVLKNCLCKPTYCIMPDFHPEWTREQANFFYNFMHLIWARQREEKA